MADLQRVKRNVAIMVQKNAPESDIDAYINSEGTSPDELRATPSQPDALPDQSPPSGNLGLYGSMSGQVKAVPQTGVLRYGRQFTNALIPGADIIRAGTTAAGQFMTGGEPTFNANLAHEWAVTNADNENNGFGDYAAKAAGMALGGYGISKLPFMAGAELPAVATNMNRLYQAGLQGARTMGAYGAAQGALDSQQTDTTGRLADTGAGMLGGMVMGAVTPAVIEGVLKFKNDIGGFVNWLRGLSPDAQQMARKAYQAFQDATGQTPQLPATVAPEGTNNALSQYVAKNRLFGGPVREAAAADAGAVHKAAQETVQQPLGNQPIADAGKDIQDFTRNQLTQRSIPSTDIARMPDADLERMTGPMGAGGFEIPKPVVEPVKPAEVTPVQPEKIDPNSINVEPAEPAMVTRPPITKANIPKETFPHSVAAQKEISAAELDMRRKFDIANAKADDFKKEFQANPDLVKQYNGDPEKLWQDLNHPHYTGPDPVKSFQDLKGAVAEREAAKANYHQTLAKWEPEREANWVNALREHYDQQNQAADDAFHKAIDKSINDAARETQFRKTQELLRQQNDANARARQETQRLQDRSQADAWAATRKAEADAQAAYERQRKQQPGFEFGRSKDTYPTEASAAYERHMRDVPKFQKNPLGGPGPSGSLVKTQTETLLDNLAKEARTSLQLKGYKDGQVFGENGEMRPDLAKHLRGLFGNDVMDRLETAADYRKKGQLFPGVQGLRDLRSSIRRAARDAERPPYPGMPRTADAAALRRLEGAVSGDIRKFMNGAGAKGERAALIDRQLDERYREHLATMRQPLAKIFGDKVEPLQAMTRLSDAAKDGNLQLLRPYMRVLKEKGDSAQISKGVAAIIAQTTDGSKNAFDFFRAVKEIKPESRAVMSATPEGKAIWDRLQALEKIAGKLQPFEKSVTTLPEIRNTVHHSDIGLGIALVTHPVAGIVASLGTYGTARLLSSPRYMQALIRAAAVKTPTQARQLISQIANTGGQDTDIGKKIAASMTQALESVAPDKAKAEEIGSKPNLWTSLEEPPTPDEVKQAVALGTKRFDFDLNTQGAPDAVAAIKKAGGKITAYHVGGGGGREWGGAKEGEGVNNFDTPEKLAQLTDDVKGLVAKGADDIHFDNTHRMSASRLEKVADAIKAGGAGFVAKNNADAWDKVMTRRPDLRPSYAVVENAMHDDDEADAAHELYNKGVPTYIIGFRKPLDAKDQPVSDEYAKEWKSKHPWAHVLLMDDEHAYDQRTGGFVHE
ncbi:MAG: hypothetical protein KGP14_03775 [Betaproteobacteria bacterium]|nr:hypothetical protein [Betaproteobacteria bacterium]